MNVSVAPRLTRAAEGLPRRRFTVAEVEAMVEAGIMDEDERVELIGGELVPMSPKRSRHEVVKAALLDRWYRARPESCRLVPETTFRNSKMSRRPARPRSASAGTSSVPDAVRPVGRSRRQLATTSGRRCSHHSAVIGHRKASSGPDRRRAHFSGPILRQDEFPDVAN
jgi:hypothetical protein